MNVRALGLGSLLGFMLAVIPSCGTPPCGPANCKGCCDAMNKCVPASAASSNTSCGTNGAACANCTTNNQVCNATSFVCENATGTGGGGGTGGGTTGGGGATGGGATGGGATGGGAATGGGGATGGGATGGGGPGAVCDVMAQNCTGAGESCLYIDTMGNGRCFTGACDVVTQNCPTLTDKCSYALSGGAGVRTCGPAGTKTEGQACGPSADDCAKGLICVGGTCKKFCYSDTICGGGTNICGNLVQVPGSQELPATCVSLQACDPLNQSSCPMGQGCYLTQNGPACIPAGNVANGMACGQTTLCVAGSTCLGPSAQMLTCHSFCNLDGGMPNCGAGQCGGILNQQMMQLPWGACQ